MSQNPDVILCPVIFQYYNENFLTKNTVPIISLPDCKENPNRVILETLNYTDIYKRLEPFKEQMYVSANSLDKKEEKVYKSTLRDLKRIWPEFVNAESYGAEINFCDNLPSSNSKTKTEIQEKKELFKKQIRLASQWLFIKAALKLCPVEQLYYHQEDIRKLFTNGTYIYTESGSQADRADAAAPSREVLDSLIRRRSMFPDSKGNIRPSVIDDVLGIRLREYCTDPSSVPDDKYKYDITFCQGSEHVRLKQEIRDHLKPAASVDFWDTLEKNIFKLYKENYADPEKFSSVFHKLLCILFADCEEELLRKWYCIFCNISGSTKRQICLGEPALRLTSIQLFIMESYIYWKQDNLKRLHRCFLLEADYDEKIRWAEEAVSSGETGDVLMACYKLLPRTEDLTNLGNNVRQINDLFFRLRICDDLPLELSEARKIAKSYNGSPQEASVNAYIAQRIREGKAFLQTLTENSELKKPEFFKHYLDTLTSHLKYCDIPTQIGRKKIPSEFSSVEMEEIHRRAMEQLPENFCYAFGQLLFYLHRKLRITYKEVIRQYAEEQTE